MTVKIEPVVNSLEQGLVIRQFGPTSGSVAGPIEYNRIEVDVQNTVTSSGLDPFHTKVSRALSVVMNEGGSNFNQLPEALFVRLNHTLGDTLPGATTDHIAAFISAYSNKFGGTTQSGLAPLDVAGYMDSGSSFFGLCIIESEAIVRTGASVAHRVGLRLNGGGEVQGSTHDSAITVVTGGPAPYKNLVMFGEAGPAQSMDSAGNIFVAQQAFTIGSIFNLPNVTVTGDIANFPNFKVSGAGRIDATSLYLNGTQVSPAASVNFSVHSASSQTPSLATWTKVNMDTVDFDTGSYFSTSSKRYTPGIAGKYRISASVYLTSTPSATPLYGIAIYKNGSALRKCFYTGPISINNEFVPCVTALVDMNGTTDYIEIYAYINNGTSPQIGGVPSTTHMDGELMGV